MTLTSKNAILSNFRSNLSSELSKTLLQISLKSKDFSFGVLDSIKYDSFVKTYTGGTEAPTFFVIDPEKQQYWFNASIGAKLASVESYLQAIASGEIPGSTAAFSFVQRLLHFVSAVLEEPLIVVVVVLIFFVIVIVAVWYISSDSGSNATEGGKDEKSEKSEKKASTSSKTSVTIEKPSSSSEADSNRSHKKKVD